MLIIVQFPLADLRPFIDADERVPIASEFSQADLAGTADFGGARPAPFLPSVGPLRKRRQGAQYAGESLYFKANNVLRFADGLHSVADPRDGAPIGVRLFFRRFQAFQDLHQLARVEIALLLDLAGRPALDAEAAAALLRTSLRLPVRIAGQAAERPLAQAGPALAAQLLRATTWRQRTPPPDWTLQARAPTVLVEHGTAELAAPLPGSRPVTVDDVPELQLAAASLVVDGVACSAWGLNTGVERVGQSWFESDIEAQRRDRARQLRINLLRHHAEREVLAWTLDCLLAPQRLDLRRPGLPAEALRRYLVGAAARLSRSRRFGFAQAGIVQAAHGIEAAALAVDASSESRYHELWANLAGVLDVTLFTGLFDALDQLPMGLPIETARLRALLQDSRSPPSKVAVSYAHADTPLMKSFTGAMAQAERQGMVEAWDDRWILAGSDWRAEIDRRFREARIVVLLVSEDFLKSHFCMQVEVPLVIERAARGEALLVPVIVRPCDWQASVLAQRQVVLPNGRPVVANGNREQAWRIVLHELLAGSRALAAAA